MAEAVEWSKMMQAVEIPEDWQTLPKLQRKARNFLWPIPALARVGAPRGVVNERDERAREKSWRASTPHVEEMPFERFHTNCLPPALARSSASRRGHGRLTGARPNAAWEESGLRPSLLDSLGVTLSAGVGEAISGRMDLYKLKDPAECEEGCYWRWLVHTLLEDVAALKRNLEETQDSQKQHDEERKLVTDKISHNAHLLEELHSMSVSLKTLWVNVPKLRVECRKKQQESEQLRHRRRKIQDEQQSLQTAITRSSEWQRDNLRKVQTIEREADEGRRHEKALGDQIHLDRDKVHKATEELKQAQAEYQALQGQMKDIEDKKAQKKADKQKAPKK